MPLKAGGEFALVKEQMEQALELSGQPVKRGTMAHDHDVYMVLADNAVLLRDAAALGAYTPRLEELATRDGHRLYLAIAHRAAGVAHRLAGEHAQAQARLDQAMALFGELGTRWQMGRTLFELGELELARSDKAKARGNFERALAEFEAMQAEPDAQRTRAALANT
jgi:tetratricopeptide (TPR) repeat protein